MRKTQVQTLGWGDPLEEEMATHSSVLAWKIPCTEEPGRLQSMGSQRVGHDWATWLSLSLSLAVQGLGLHASTAGVMDSALGCRTKIPHAMWCFKKTNVSFRFLCNTCWVPSISLRILVLKVWGIPLHHFWQFMQRLTDAPWGPQDAPLLSLMREVSGKREG